MTVGEDVEIRSEQLFKQGNYTVGLLLDAAATTAVEQVADQVNEVINTIAKKNKVIKQHGALVLVTVTGH